MIVSKNENVFLFDQIRQNFHPKPPSTVYFVMLPRRDRKKGHPLRNIVDLCNTFLCIAQINIIFQWKENP